MNLSTFIFSLFFEHISDGNISQANIHRSTIYQSTTFFAKCNRNVPFYHFSGKVKKSDLPINENNKFHPASPYAISKIGTDFIAKYYYDAFGLRILTTRMFTHTGPRRSDFFAESTFAKQIALIENGRQKKEILVGNLNSLRTVADVRDAVRAYYILVTKKPKFGEAYNIGGNHTCKVGDILKFLLRLSILKSNSQPIDFPIQFFCISLTFSGQPSKLSKSFRS